MKPQFEKVTIPHGCSVRIYDRRIKTIPFEWHLHPEFELTLTLNSKGLRFVGNSVESYDSKDLVLIPPDMPHTWASREAVDATAPHRAIVIWFRGEWAMKMAELCPEYEAIVQLLDRAATALHFCSAASRRMMIRLPEVLSDSPAKRLHGTLALLLELAEIEGKPLASLPATPPRSATSGGRINRVIEVLHKQYSEQLRIDALARLANMSSRTLHRAFVDRFGESIRDYLRKLRIAHACMLLVETDLSMTEIAERSGFVSKSNFNRAFLDTRQMPPKDFRRFVRLRNSAPKFRITTNTSDSES